jgi:hypothetical protein
MIGLLVAFFLYHGNADWWWWAIWGILEVGELFKFVRNN